MFKLKFKQKHCVIDMINRQKLNDGLIFVKYWYNLNLIHNIMLIMWIKVQYIGKLDKT